MNALARVALVEAEMAKLQGEIAVLKKSLAAAVEFIRGNGDPTKGLLWVTADLTRLLATNTQMIETHRQLLAEHVITEEARFARHLEVAHREVRSEFWETVQTAAIKQLVTGVIITVLALISLGVITFVRNGGHL